MKQFSIYISNERLGTCRDLVIFSKDASSARRTCEDCCLRENEVVFSVYPTEKTPPRRYENKF